MLAWAQEQDTIVSWQENDSIKMAPLQVEGVGADNYDDLTRPQSSLDLENPDNVKTSIEYDPLTGYYVMHTRIGDVDIATPYLMTSDEYRAYSERETMGKYWQSKISEVEHDNEKKFDITDMKFNIGPADKVFGPGGVQLKMQGSAELLFGFKHQYVDNPALTERSRNNNIFDFDEKIQVNVNGKVGDKLNMNLSYNTEASFDFDQQNLKLNYKGQEDDIIQSLEAGNVSMNLNSSLIQGSSALFGIKTDLKFGKLKVQALISQQNSESQSVSSKGGAQTTSFEVPIDSYDENRHFFLSYYFRDNYEQAMQSLPYIASGVTINRIEVWVTNKRGNYDQARNIVALTDLGENDPQHILNASISATSGARMPYNKANSLYQTLAMEHTNIRDIQQISSVMQNLTDMDLSEDYEKIESARLLNNGEYTLNAALGYISLKTALNQDEVLAVAYEYTYGGQVYQVGEFSTDGVENMGVPNAALLLKMLKSTNNAPTHKNKGTWDLMMKNVYSLGASQISSDKFELYIQYRNDSVGTEMQYLMEGDIKGKQLLRVMNLDRLDSRNNASPDGRFDYVEGYTALSSSGRIIFPVLEPFGSHLAQAIGNPTIAEKYIFQELYDSTLVSAQELSEKNKFVLMGKYKGSAGNEIRLNAMNIPRGSVVVTAGGATLIENVDYTVDYTMGTVTILNQSIIDAGTNVDVKLENQSLFSMQRKSLFGAHLEYEFNKDFTVGGTIMHLREKPLTTKVNTGSEPLANTIWGVNTSWKTELQWLTLLIDKVPWIEATAPSTFQLNAEFAHLIPGHTKDVGQVGTAYIDDFEATKTNIDIHYPSYWRLASTPTGDRFVEADESNDIAYNKNRALLAWYTVDPIFGIPQSNTPKHIKDDPEAMSDHRTRVVMEQEIYPDKQSLPNADSKLAVMNLSFYPEERGPYNISADEIGFDGKLTNPKQRWGGIMRKLDNTDFEKANIEYIEFWLMDPFLTNADAAFEGGDLYIDLGDVSEDILRDGKKSFEHGLPLNNDETLIDRTIWGRSPKTTSTVVAFANEAGAREKQDVGLNGLSTIDEFLFDYNGSKPYADYVDTLRNRVDQAVLDMWAQDDFSPLNDPAGDNYHYYRGDDYDQRETPVLERYKRFNGTEGNSPEMGEYDAYGTASTLQPDIEDINQDNTLNDNERFYRYHISLRQEDMQRVGQQHIASIMETNVTLRTKETVKVKWYQFKIPLRGDSATMKKVGNIRNFKSIRFARIYMTNFSQETHLRLATLDLVRGEWRNYTKGLYQDAANNQYNIANPYTTSGSMVVEAVNIEENSNRTPVNYVLPPGVSRQTDPGQAQLIEQNEQSMVFRFNHLAPKDARAVYKNVVYDMRQYKRLQMFVHAECLPQYEAIEDKDVSCFIRLGSDIKNNYYEYEIPLNLTPEGLYNDDNREDREKVWRNQFDFALSALTQAKMDRNRAKRSGNTNVGNTIPYETYDPENLENKITILGNPTLEDIQSIMIGIRNKTTDEVSGEVWVNELRLSEFNEQGGVAAMANAALSISDIAQVNVAGRLETAGYGSIESNVLDRNMEDMYQLSVSAALEGGRLFPEKAKLQIPLYVSYTNQTETPDFDPLDTDIKLSESLDTYETKAEKDSIRSMANTTHESTSFSVSNLKVDIHSKKRNMFYDPANFSISASYNEQKQYSPEIEQDLSRDYKGSFNYSYNFNPQPWEPFKEVKAVQKVKFLSELNFYYLPQSWAFNTNMHRTFTHLKMRDFNTTDLGAPVQNDMDLTFSKDFTWDRNFDFKYDLTKNMKFTFQTAMNSTVDEGYYTPEIIKDYAFTNDYYEAWKDTIQRSLATWGTPYTYQQLFSASWNVPFNRIPYLEALTANASYNATYNWNRTVQSNNSTADLGNVVSSTRAWQVDGALNFETLYGKSKYWKQMSQRYNQRATRRRAFRAKDYTTTVTLEAGESREITHRLGSESLKLTATTADGKDVKLKYNTLSTTKISVESPVKLENVSIKITTQDPNKRTPAQITGDMFAYFGTMLRKVQVTYRNTSSLTIPGFAPQAGFMGQQRFNDMYAPGFDFAFGGFTDDFVEKAKENGWLSNDTSVVQPATRAKTSDLDIKLVVEPFPGFKIQVNGKRYEAQSSSIIYSYDQLQENMTGSFNITQVAIGTAFQRIGTADDNFASETFNQFLNNRDVINSRVQQQYDGIAYPNAGFIPTNLRGKPYEKSHGRIANNTADVLVPAFLAAYTGRDASNVGLNPFLGLLNILPNWSVTFDGLGRLPWMRDHFKSVNLTHAYTCKYAIGSYSSFSTWVPALDLDNKQVGFVRDVATDNPIPSSAYDISSVTLTENFSPLIGLNMTMKNSLSAKVEYRKQRNISLNVNSVQITEGHTDEFVIGAGYTIKDLNFITKNRDGGQKKVSNDLKLNVDVSYKDIKTLLRKVEERITQASSGNKVFGIKISADYVLSQKINLQLFYDHQGTTPLISSSYPIKADNVGINIKLMLTR